MQIPIISHRGQKKPWGSIPRINWAHPFAVGLQFYGYDVGGVVIDLVGGGIGRNASTTPLNTITSSAFGSANKYVNGNTTITMPVNIRNVGTSTAPFTWACSFIATAAPSSALAQMFGISNTDGSFDAFAFYQASSTTIGYGWNNTAGDVITVPNFVNTGFHTCCGVAISNTNNFDYYDGALNTTVTTGSVNSALTAERYTFNGLAFTAGTGTINGSVFYGAYWTRALSAREARKLHDDPWCFLIYPEDEMFATLVGASAFNAATTYFHRPFTNIGRRIVLIGAS